MFDNKLFLLQIAVIIAFSYIVSGLFRRLGQPRVVGEMVAGIALGPTLFGVVAPATYQALFPPESLSYLNALSQIGVAIFLFLIGVRVDFEELRQQSGIAVVTSNISVIVPMLGGLAIAQYLFPRYGTGNLWHFALFLGTAMSVTAFPVLARILMERNLLGTRLGSVAIASAAVDDITAWVLLAVIVTLTRTDAAVRPFWLTLVYLGIYVGGVLALAKALRRWSDRFDEKRLPMDSILIFVVLALISGVIGEHLGVHALIGAFMAGLATPRKFRQQLVDKLEAVTLLIMMPLFFALTGIRTNLAINAGGDFYLDFALILLVAVVTKWGGTMVGAMAKGMRWRDACQLGLLMNTRGLVGLVILNVGLDIGILSPPLFSMMVTMALVTTFMATPLMDAFGSPKLKIVDAA